MISPQRSRERGEKGLFDLPGRCRQIKRFSHFRAMHAISEELVYNLFLFRRLRKRDNELLLSKNA